MKKRILSLFAAFVLFASILPSAVLAEGTAAEETGKTTYETLREIPNNADDDSNIGELASLNSLTNVTVEKLPAKADFSKANVVLKRSEFTYSGETMKPYIQSVTLDGNEVDYTVSGDIEKINAGSYKLRIEAKDESVYSGFVEVDWTILPCALNYNVELEPKLYDATHSATVKSIEFYTDNSEIVSLSKEDYYVVEESVRYYSAEVGSNYGDGYVFGDAEVRLADTDNAKNYILYRGIIKGHIKPAPIADADKYHGYKINIRYNDKSEKIIGASAFGAPNDKNYRFVGDSMPEKSEFVPNGSFGRVIKLSLKDDVTEKDIGKQYIHNCIIYTLNGCYTTKGKTLPLTIEIVDKSEPELTVETITAVYDGNEITSDKIKGTATYDGKEIEDTWSFEGNAPKNVADKKCTVKFTPTETEIYKEVKKEDVEVKISPRDIGDNRYIKIDDGEFRYNGSAHEPGVLVKDGRVELERDKDYTVEYKDNIDAGWAKVWIIGINNYSFKILGGEFRILNANAKFITEPSAKTDLIYNGEEQELITAGVADGGTVQYSFGNNVWINDIPKAKEAGSYIVFFAE